MSQKKTPHLTDQLKPYDEDFFRLRSKWRSDYDVIAKWLAKNIEGDSFGDVGCGNGYIISKLGSLGKKVWGVDGAVNIDSFVDKDTRKYVQRADLTQPQSLPSADVVLSFEVAERLADKHLKTLLDSMASTNATTIVFTFSLPGQAGIHHVNLQTREYWLEWFGRYGYHLDAALSLRFKRELTGKLKNITWYPQNVIILHKYDLPRLAQAYEDAGSVIEQLTAEVEDLKRVNKKMFEEYYATAQHLNKILGSARWKVVTKALRLIKR